MKTEIVSSRKTWRNLEYFWFSQVKPLSLECLGVPLGTRLILKFCHVTEYRWLPGKFIELLSTSAALNDGQTNVNVSIKAVQWCITNFVWLKGRNIRVSLEVFDRFSFFVNICVFLLLFVKSIVPCYLMINIISIVLFFNASNKFLIVFDRH